MTHHIPPRLDWSYDPVGVRIDDTVTFGIGWDFFGMTYLRQEAIGPDGDKYAIWKDAGLLHGPRWSAYRESDGLLALQLYESEDSVKAEVDRWAYVVGKWPQEKQQCPDCCEALVRCKCGGGE